jgi:hypothetical protein
MTLDGYELEPMSRALSSPFLIDVGCKSLLMFLRAQEFTRLAAVYTLDQLSSLFYSTLSFEKKISQVNK